MYTGAAGEGPIIEKVKMIRYCCNLFSRRKRNFGVYHIFWRKKMYHYNETVFFEYISLHTKTGGGNLHMNKLLSLVSFVVVLALMLLLPATADARLSDLIQQGMSWEYSYLQERQPPRDIKDIYIKVYVDSLEERNDSMIVTTSETYSGIYYYKYQKGQVLVDTIYDSIGTLRRETYALVADRIVIVDTKLIEGYGDVQFTLGGLLSKIFPGDAYRNNDQFTLSIDDASYAFGHRSPSCSSCFHNTIGLINDCFSTTGSASALYWRITLLSYCDSSINASRIIQQLDSLRTPVTHKNIIPKPLSIVPSRSFRYDLLGREIPATLPQYRIPVLSIELISRQAKMTGCALTGK